MKIRFYLALAAAALVMTNCSQDEELVQVKQSTKGFTATIEGASRSDVTEAGVFSWTAGDKISVWNGTTFDVYANSEGNESTFVAEDEEAGTPTGYAIYPASEDHEFADGTLLVNLPATYTHGSTNAPMLATITEGSSTLAFKHLGGLMRFVVKNVPVGASSFVFTTTNNILTGGFGVNDGQITQPPAVVPVTDENNNVTISFDALEEVAESMVFFVPLPVGTYGEYTVAIEGDNLQGTYSHTSTGVTNTIGRCTMLLMPEFNVENGELKKGAGNTIPVNQDEAANLSGIQNVTIGTDNAGTNEELDINYTPLEGNAILNITDDSNATESQDSKAKIKIIPTDTDTQIESLNLNTPSLTAELGAGTYGTVEALTAKQTLIIAEGVTIETLILNGGALEVAEGATTSTIENIVVKDAASFIEAFKVAKNIIFSEDIEDDIDLALTTETALTVAEGDEVSIDLGGNTLITSSVAASQDDFTVNGKLNVSNGTISTSNCAFWVDGGDLTLNECTVESERTGITTISVFNGGSLEATDCKMNVAGTALKVRDGASMTLTGCEATTSSTTGSAVVTSDGTGTTLTIDGGSYTGTPTDTQNDRYVIGVKGGSTATINTTVTNGNGGVTIIGGSTATLTGGSYSGGKACGLYVAGESAVTYTSECTFSGVEGDVVVGGGEKYGAGTVNNVKYTEHTIFDYVSTPEEFKSAFDDCNNIILTAAIDLALTAETALTVAEGDEVSIDLGGNTLITSSVAASQDDFTVNGKLNVSNGTISTSNCAFWVDGGDLTLNECTVNSERTGITTISVFNGGSLEATDCKMNVAGTALKVRDGASMTLTGCEATTSSTTGSAVVTSDGTGTTLTIDGGSYTGTPTDTQNDRYVIGVKGGSTATINATVQNGNGGVTVLGGSKVDLTGGSYSGGKVYGLFVNQASTVTYTSDCVFSSTMVADSESSLTLKEE